VEEVVEEGFVDGVDFVEDLEVVGGVIHHIRIPNARDE
jgi:hypothetical protein